jgi:hypothetical protein
MKYGWGGAVDSALRYMTRAIDPMMPVVQRLRIDDGREVSIVVGQPAWRRPDTRRR